MRLIDADALKDRVGYIEEEYGHIMEEINNAPTIDAVERKNGKWKRHYSRPNVYADLYWHCSECGYKNDNNYANVYHKFCPNCGAEMRGENNG